MTKFNLKQSQEEHKNNIELTNISHKFAIKMTILICSFVFTSILILAFAFGTMNTLVGIIITIVAMLLLTVLSGALTRSVIV